MRGHQIRGCYALQVLSVRIPQEPAILRTIPHPRIQSEGTELLPDRHTHRLPRSVHQSLRGAERGGRGRVRTAAINDHLILRLHHVIQCLRARHGLVVALPRHAALRSGGSLPHGHP